jgi:thioredoxin-dependent peroxiredoxin
MKLEPKMEAPGFYAPDQTGVMHSLQDYIGKFVLLYFYPKDDTPGCTTEACSFRDHYADLRKHLVLLGVSADTSESHKKFVEKYQLPFPLLADPDKKLIRSYGTDGLLFAKRTSFLIDPHGVILKVYEKVAPADHAEEILKDMKSYE